MMPQGFRAVATSTLFVTGPWCAERRDWEVLFWKWLGLKALLAAQTWSRIHRDLETFELPIQTRGLRLRGVVYRKSVHHVSPKNFQLDLFDPNDGYFGSALPSNRATLQRRQTVEQIDVEPLLHPHLVQLWQGDDVDVVYVVANLVVPCARLKACSGS
jgi:hypothetical protein